jgi:hypothetical protein
MMRTTKGAIVNPMRSIAYADAIAAAKKDTRATANRSPAVTSTRYL